MALTDCNTNTVLTDKPENVNYLANNFFQFHIDRIPNFTYFIQSANLPMLSTRSINQPSTLGTFPKIPATNFIFTASGKSRLMDCVSVTELIHGFPRMCAEANTEPFKAQSVISHATGGTYPSNTTPDPSFLPKICARSSRARRSCTTCWAGFVCYL